MTTKLRRRVAALALVAGVPAGVGALVANTSLLALTADGGMPTMPLPPLPGGPKVTKPIVVVDPPPVVDTTIINPPGDLDR